MNNNLAGFVTLLAGTLAVAGCSATDEVATTTVTPDRPVIQPGAPGEANTTHTGAITMPVEEPTAADVTFAQAMMGAGVAIRPENESVAVKSTWHGWSVASKRMKSVRPQSQQRRRFCRSLAGIWIRCIKQHSS